MSSSSTALTRDSSAKLNGLIAGFRRKVISHLIPILTTIFLTSQALAQTITIVGTAHLTGLKQPPNAEQLAHTVNALAAFQPTQVCVERMSGERIEALMADPERNAMTLRPETAGRPLSTVIVPTGVEMQGMLGIQPSDARDTAAALVSSWDKLDTAEQIRTIGLQLAGYELHSAVLNWSHLDDNARQQAREKLGAHIAERLHEALDSVHEAYSLGVALSHKAGLHQICTADSQEDETRGMQAAMAHGGDALLNSPEARDPLNQLAQRSASAWQPDNGPGALTAMLRFFNSSEFAEFDRQLQWETLRNHDNEAGAFQRRLMYWHARTAEISAELYRALAKGPDERILLIIGAAHRPFTEAELRSQPWVSVKPASVLLEAE
ncbi:MAG: hypothetical protein Tsb002_20890 [Wenzhouxiangellaceae bacterium]